MKLVKLDEGDINGFTQKATLYRVTEPFTYEFLDDEYLVEHVVVASSNGMFGSREAAVFACNQEGEPVEDMVKLASGGTPRQALFSFIEKYIQQLDLDRFIEDGTEGGNQYP